jgi:hypothetical protein
MDRSSSPHLHNQQPRCIAIPLMLLRRNSSLCGSACQGGFGGVRDSVFSVAWCSCCSLQLLLGSVRFGSHSRWTGHHRHICTTNSPGAWQFHSCCCVETAVFVEAHAREASEVFGTLYFQLLGAHAVACSCCWGQSGLDLILDGQVIIATFAQPTAQVHGNSTHAAALKQQSLCKCMHAREASEVFGTLYCQLIGAQAVACSCRWGLGAATAADKNSSASSALRSCT